MEITSTPAVVSTTLGGMKRSHLVAVLLTMTLGSLPLFVQADLPPPADWKDPCLSTKIGPDEECIQCGSPEFKARACHQRAAREGYRERCRGWSYVKLCRPRSQPADGGAGKRPGRAK
jgi:hypothetical protein